MTDSSLTFNLPPSSLPIVDVETGAPTPQFYFMLLSIQNRTGGTDGINLITVNATADAALVLGQTNSNQIVTISGQIGTIETTLAALQTQTNTNTVTANNAVNLAQNVRSTSLQRSNNLSDLTNTSQARQNLGVSLAPAVFAFPTPSASQIVSIPIVEAVTLPASFAGFQTYCFPFGTADAVFTVQLVRNNVTIPIGFITLIHLGNFNSVTSQPAVALIAGDCLQVMAPVSPDATLRGVAIALALTL